MPEGIKSVCDSRAILRRNNKALQCLLLNRNEFIVYIKLIPPCNVGLPNASHIVREVTYIGTVKVKMMYESPFGNTGNGKQKSFFA